MTAEQIRLIRLMNGMTQRAFADHLNVSRPLITMIERNERVITERTKRRVYEVFGLNDEKLRQLEKMRGMVERWQ